ncbi:MAG: gliding motility-associated C-terminal domain-containing protein, partial [Bacteroidales bacterium]
DYTVTVTDATGCSTSDVSSTLTLTDPSLISITSETSTDASCFGANDGTVTVSATGGTPPFTYTISPGGTSNGTGSFTNLAPDDYTVEVTDVNNCLSAISGILTVAEPDQLVITGETATDISCNGANDGTINLTVSGGTGPYEYTLSPGNITNSTGTFTNLSQGNYTVSVSDANSCGPVTTGTLVINEPDPIIIDSQTSQDVSCNGAGDGEIQVTATGGTAPLTYTLNPGGISNGTGIFTNLDGGSYTVTVEDANSCPSATTPAILINDPDPISIATETKNDITCNGANDGEINVTATGGTGTLTYTLNPGGISNTTGTFINLGPNIYTVTVDDDNACPSAISANIEIVEPLAIIIDSESATDISCTGANDGEVSVAVSGGTPPYNFTLQPGGQTNSTGTFTGLTAGDYSIEVTDASLCPVVTSNTLTIAEPLPIVIDAQTSQDVSCNGAGDGEIRITASGGTAPLSYTLDPVGITNATGDFTLLSGGTYTVTVNDANSCPPAIAPAIEIIDPDPITITDEIETDITCNGAGDGTITITATGGTGVLTYTLSPGAISNTTGIFNNLEAGDYTVTVDDQNGCPSDVSSSLKITEPGEINVIVLGSSKLSLGCFEDADGEINITINGGKAPYTPSWTGPDSFTSDQEDISGLTAGTYTLNVTDANGCSLATPLEVLISQPPALTINLTGSDITCFGDADGFITVTAAGGTLPYEYSRNGISYQLSNVFSGLSQNNYTIFVRDANGCIISDNITLTEPDELIVKSEIRIDNNQCFGDSLGEITILEVEGGSRPYEYSINGGTDFFPDSVFTNLPADDYQTIVRDANGCSAFGNLNVINQPSEIRITNYVQNDVTDCFGNNNGQIFIEATGGTISKTYTLDGSETNTSGIFNTVSGGEHLITITDLNGCTKDTTVTLTEPDEIVFTSITISNITTCAGEASGEVSLEAEGGTGTLSYAIDVESYQATQNFSGLSAGAHILSVMDDNSCVVDSIITITEPQPISIDSETATDASCNGANDGTISVRASGGTPGYTYTLNPGGATSTDGDFTNLAPGDYTIDIVDAQNCGPVTSSILTIAEPAAIVVDSVSTSGILCNGDDNAEIHIFLSGGTPPYEYSIDDGASFGTSGDFVGLSPGTYRVAVSDANGCIVPVDTFDFTAPPALAIISETVTDINTCFGDANGEISFEVNGGTGNIEYSIDNGTSWQADGTFTGLNAGDYSILAMDEKACQISSSNLRVRQPDEITADITTTPALSEDIKGSITISNARGGTGIFEFSISGPGGPFTADTVFTELDEGTYIVVIRDENGCPFQDTVEITQYLPLDVTISFANPSCFGANDGSIQFFVSNPVGEPRYSVDDSATWSSENLFENLAPGSYYLYVIDGNRIFQDTIDLTEPPAPEVFRNITPASCSAFSPDGGIDITVNGIPGAEVSYSWSNGAITEDLNNIEAGTYWVTASDENQCSVTDTIIVPAITTVTADAGEDTTICYGEELLLNGQSVGSTSVEWSPAEGLSDVNILNPVFQSYTDKSYILRADGDNECYDIDTLNITVLPRGDLRAGNDTTVAENVPVTIYTTGDSYQNYRWEPAIFIDDTTSSSPTFTILETTTYIVSAEAENGCIDRDTITLSLVDRLVIYSAFTPNNDGVNDFWDIDYAELYPDITVEVFTRWGERIFSSKGYSDDKRWDGTFKGKEAPTGTYYYVVVPKKGASALTGPVTIVR